MLQLLGDNAVPFKVTLFAPFTLELPKLVPVMVNAVPAAPEAGDSPVIFGGTAILAPLLTWPATFTNTEPLTTEFGMLTVMLVSLQLEAVATATAVPIMIWLLP